MEIKLADGESFNIKGGDGLEVNGQSVAIPDLTPYAKTVEVLPRYRFVDAAIVDGVVTIAPYTNTKILSDGTAFAVEVGEGSGYARDCVLVVDCGETSPSVIFDDTKFFPRGGDAANLEVVAWKRNVFFITEVQPNVFMVARDELALPNEGGGE